MELVQHILLGFVPGAFWLLYLRRTDDHEPEPWGRVLIVFAAGGLAAWGVIATRRPFENLVLFEWLSRTGDTNGYPLIDSFLITAPLEESWKAVALVLGVCWHRELDEPIDGIIYGTAAGLGFASIENVFYIEQHGEAVIWVRSFTATLTHVCASGAVGFCYGLTRLPRWRNKFWLMGVGLAVAVLFHGSYNWFLLKGQAWVSLLVTLPAMLLILRMKINWARSKSEEYH